MKKKYFIYVSLILFMCFALFVLTFFGGGSLENEKGLSLAAAFEKSTFENGESGFGPALAVDEALSGSFGGRSFFIEAYTFVLQHLFRTSANEDVILGSDGYLFFADTLPTYTGEDVLSDAETLELLNALGEAGRECEEHGAKLYFVVAPNKNSLYGEYMPKKIVAGDRERSNVSALSSVNTDLFEAFNASDEVLYYKTDTHWNDKGALLAAGIILERMGKSTDNSLYENYSVRRSKTGDLQKMLYPKAKGGEEEFYYSEPCRYEYLTKTRSTEQSYFETYNSEGTGSLVVFRDSFFNNMVDYFSNEYEYVIYDKSVPYDLSLIDKYGAKDVIIEIAERNIPVLLSNLKKTSD